jgi:hypothetical protein
MRAFGAGVRQQHRETTVIEPSDLIDRAGTADKQSGQSQRQAALVCASAEKDQGELEGITIRSRTLAMKDDFQLSPGIQRTQTPCLSRGLYATPRKRRITHKDFPARFQERNGYSPRQAITPDPAENRGTH